MTDDRRSPNGNDDGMHDVAPNAVQGDRKGAQALQPGAIAPGFSLPSTPDQRLTLAELRGRPVVLAFYPADWSPVCGDQMALYNQVLPEFAKFGAQMVGISVDGVWCHRAFAEQRNLHFPLLSDFEPKGAVAQSYGVYRQAEGTSERALFVLDGAGKVYWSYVSPVGVNPGADGILEALESLATNARPADIPPERFRGRRQEDLGEASAETGGKSS